MFGNSDLTVRCINFLPPNMLRDKYLNNLLTSVIYLYFINNICVKIILL